MSGSPDPLGRFREELIAAGAEHHSRRRRRHAITRRAASAALVVSVALVGVVSLTVGRTGPAGASVVVTRDGNMWEVAVANDDATAAMVEAALAEHGVDGIVAAVPVGPSRVGQFVSGDSAVSPSEGHLSAPTVRFPAGQHRVHLLFGRTAGPGERYVAASDAFAAGEPLECLDGIWRQPAAAALPAVVSRFDVVTVIGDDGRTVDEPGEQIVGDVLVVADGHAIVRVHDGTLPPATLAGSAACPLR